jgi:hypothetical protein
LTGWKIDIKSESQAGGSFRSMSAGLEDVEA